MFIFPWQEYESDVDEETRQFILDQNEETRKLIIGHLKEMDDRWGNVFKTIYHINWQTGLPIDPFVNDTEIKIEKIRLKYQNAGKVFLP